MLLNEKVYKKDRLYNFFKFCSKYTPPKSNYNILYSLIRRFYQKVWIIVLIWKKGFI